MEDLSKLDWINANDRNNPSTKPKVRKIDETVSKIVGKPILMNDPRLLKLVVSWKKPGDELQMDNFLNDPKKLAQLKEAFK